MIAVALQRAEKAAMTVAQRVALALDLGRRCLEIYRSVNGLTEEQARAELRRRRHIGRRRSRCAESLDGD